MANIDISIINYAQINLHHAEVHSFIIKFTAQSDKI